MRLRRFGMLPLDEDADDAEGFCFHADGSVEVVNGNVEDFAFAVFADGMILVNPVYPDYLNFVTPDTDFCFATSVS